MHFLIHLGYVDFPFQRNVNLDKILK